MSKSVIKVHNLSKRYRIGLKEKQADTLSGQIGNILKFPFTNLKKLREMSRFGLEDESVFWALKDISFEVKQGEVLGIIGKNGAGKSTLLKILSQITEPTSGKIEIHGRVASLLEVGTGFHPELSGRENIYMNGTILGMTRKEIDHKLDEIIGFSGVEKFIDTPVKFYSSGMKVRLGFSVAAHLDPEILIIDEVLAVGDYEFQKKCLGKMEDVSKNQGRTVLFVSHDLNAISLLSSNAILLESSKVKYIGEVKEVISNYKSNDLNINATLKSEFNLKNGFEWTHIEITQKSKIVDHFFSDEDISIKIQYNILFDVKNFRIYLDVFDSNLELISRSFFDEGCTAGTNLSSGYYQSIIVIKSNLFIHGSYFFKIRACQHDVFNYEPKDGVLKKIQIFEKGKFKRKEFAKINRGIIILPIEWNTKKF
jgi:lipopolysaccharide transport system ATP-binding protein